MTSIRRAFGYRVAALVAVLALVGAACTTPPGSPNYHTYQSTTVTPPTWRILANPGTPVDGVTLTATQTNAPGIVRGFNIFDESGEPVWSQAGSAGNAVFADLKVVDWGGGQQALAMHEGKLFTGQQGVSEGKVRVLDSSYDEIGVFAPQGGQLADLHDFIVTDTSFFFLIYDPVPMDLSSYGGSANATVFDGVIQEVDRLTNDVLWEWHSLPHIPVTESVQDLTAATVDYLHINSLELDASGDVLISARNTNAIYMIDKDTEDVLWRLGGSDSDFTFTNDQGFYRQHDARILPDGTIGLFDNGETGIREWSRGVRFELDHQNMTATRVQELRHSPDIFGFAMGNVEWLPNGNALVGWGTAEGFTEFDASGGVVMDVEYPGFSTYRTRRQPWVGTPSTPPDVVVLAGTFGFQDVYMSWNGSTETAQWRIEGGDPGNMSVLATAPRKGFETKTSVLTDVCDFAVTPLDSGGAALAAPVEVQSQAPACLTP